MIIGSIVDGIVIDHIPAGRGMEIYRYLKLDELDCEVALIKNASSEKYGKKDIVKTNEIIDLDLDMLGFIAPQITVTFIRDGKRVKKLHPKLPKKLINVIRCKNPRCITSVEQGLQQEFYLSDEEKGDYRCIYCDTLAEKSGLL